MHEMQNHNSAPIDTAPTALPIPMPIRAGVCNPVSGDVEGPTGPTNPAVLYVAGGGVKMDVFAEAVIICVVITVMTEPPLLVVRDVEVVREAVGVLGEVELGAAVGVVLDGDDPCVASEQYAVKLGKHDDWG
jgi:hypothetical protein